jgi:hypothetical protein
MNRNVGIVRRAMRSGGLASSKRWAACQEDRPPGRLFNDLPFSGAKVAALPGKSPSGNDQHFEIGNALSICSQCFSAYQSQLDSCDFKRAETRMAFRAFGLVLATVVGCGSAAGQSWQEYSYPDQFFTVAFPGAPQITTTTYQASDDRSVKAYIYSVRQDNAMFRVTIAELADTGLEESAVVDHAIKTMSAGGEVKVNIPHRVNRIFGRQISIAGPDGSRSMAAVFDYNGRLYQIEGIALPAGNDATADAIRFVQSLAFTGGGSNRPEDQTRAARGACGNPGGQGVAAGQDNAVPGDSRRGEIRCRRRQIFAALAASLNSGDLSAAQQAYSSLSQLQSGDQARFANPNGPFAQAMGRIGEALQSGDLMGAQQALASLQRGRRAQP